MVDQARLGFISIGTPWLRMSQLRQRRALAGSAGPTDPLSQP